MHVPDTAPGSARGSARAARCGALPPLAAGFTVRPETATSLPAALAPGTVVVLIPARAAASSSARHGRTCGKTQLAVWYAESLWHSGQVDLLAWIDASSRTSVLAGCADAAAAAGLDPVGPAEHAAAGLAGWLACTTRPWLVVLDDLRDPADLDGLWLRGPAGTVVITTPDEQAISGEHGLAADVVLSVGAFSTREAMSYLTGCLAADPDQRHGAIDLTLALDADPTALAHAAALLSTTTQTCQDYRHRYTVQRGCLAARPAEVAPPAAAAVTWMLSVERADQLAPARAAGLLLALAALLDAPAIPVPLLTSTAACAYLADTGAAASDPGAAGAAVRALELTGLLAVDATAAPPLAWISRQLAAHARAATPAPLTQQAATAAGDALLETWPDPESPRWLATILRTCAAGLERTAGDRLWTADACHRLLRHAGHSLDAARLTGPAVVHWTRLVGTSQRLLGPGHPHTLAAGTDLARALQAARQSADALTWWQWAAAGHARLHGPDHPAALAARVSVGQAMTAAGQTGDAITVLDQAVADCERVRGPGHPAALAARRQLAAACQAAGQPDQAISHYRRILADQERRCGPRHPGTITAREDLAAACQAAGQVREAISGYRKALSDRQRTMGAGDPAILAARRRLAAACQQAGQIAAALQLHDQASAACQRALGEDHPDTLACRADLASAYRAAGRLADAAAVLRGTLARCERTLPPGHPLTRAVRQNLASIADS
jgi:tetratricopeptide (TPR) repeat protein